MIMKSLPLLRPAGLKVATGEAADRPEQLSHGAELNLISLCIGAECNRPTGFDANVCFVRRTSWPGN